MDTQLLTRYHYDAVSAVLNKYRARHGSTEYTGIEIGSGRDGWWMCTSYCSAIHKSTARKDDY